MKASANYTVDDVVLQHFAAASKRHREELLRIFDFLATNPHTKGDTLQRDHTGRQCSVKRFGAWAVTYWSEHFVSQIHIVDIERLR